MECRVRPASIRGRPRCDCTHVPVTQADDSLRFDARKAFDAGQVTGLNAGEAQAIRDGADISRVVNARRGMSDNGLTTTEAATRGRQRLTPQAVLDLYPDRAQAIEQLRRHGYIL
jgi:hypothetical protein